MIKMKRFYFSIVCVFTLFCLAKRLDALRLEDQHDPSQMPFNETCSPLFCSNQAAANSTRVIDYCRTQNGRIEARCCLTNSSIIAVDYTFCDIEKLANTIGALDRDSVKNITILDARHNKKLIDCGNEQVFEGFLKLDELYLSDALPRAMCHCPGGNSSWSTVGEGQCSGRLDFCQSKTNAFVNCTPSSYCTDNGPGNFLCLCKENYHGYKCLAYGQFPAYAYAIGLSLSTLILSGVLWHFQRRHVIKQD